MIKYRDVWVVIGVLSAYTQKVIGNILIKAECAGTGDASGGGRILPPLLSLLSPHLHHKACSEWAWSHTGRWSGPAAMTWAAVIEKVSRETWSFPGAVSWKKGQFLQPLSRSCLSHMQRVCTTYSVMGRSYRKRCLTFWHLGATLEEEELSGATH